MDMTSGTNTSRTKHSSSYEENFKHLLEGIRLRFPGFQHGQHSPIVDVNVAADEHMSTGQRIADIVASGMGSWRFIIAQTILLALWIILNLVGWINHWDPYPFIFLNLALSFQAAYSAPIIMMSQNRQAAKDRLTAESDYKTNVKGEQEVCHVMDHLDHQDDLTREILLRLETQNQRLEKLDTLILQIVQQLEQQHEGFATQHQEILQRLSELEKR
jgi:uncharacterized membrane protein